MLLSKLQIVLPQVWAVCRVIGLIVYAFNEIFLMADQVVALFPYTAQNEDELSFLQGDVLVIVDRDDPAWWRGQLKGKVCHAVLLFLLCG